MKNTIKLLALIVLTWISEVASAQKIGFLMDSYVIDRWHIDQKCFEDRVVELGGECVVEIPYGDAEEQLKLGRKLIQEGVDALVVVPTDSKKAAAIAAEAKKAGIPVISYDRMILSEDVSFHVSFNSEKIGNLQALYASSRVPSGNYLLINGPNSDHNATVLRDAQMQILQPYIDAGNIKIVGDIVLNDWSEIEAIMKTEDYFDNKKNIKPEVIIAANDALADGVLKSLPTSLRGKVLVTGQDAESIALRNIIIGEQSMTIYKPFRELAYTAAEIAIKLARGEHITEKERIKTGGVEVDAILLDPTVVDKYNYQSTVVKDGQITRAELVSINKDYK